MTFRKHPSPARLQAWLDDGTPARVGRHVSDCERCLTSLEQLSGLDDAVVADIAEVLAPPADIENRTSTGLERRLHNEDVLLTFLDLFAVGWTAVKTIIEDEEDVND